MDQPSSAGCGFQVNLASRLLVQHHALAAFRCRRPALSKLAPFGGTAPWCRSRRSVAPLAGYLEQDGSVARLCGLCYRPRVSRGPDGRPKGKKTKILVIIQHGT